MEWNSHNTIGQIKCFLNAIAMMNVDVNIQYTGMVFQQFQYRNHDVIHVTETGRFEFFRMMQTAGPIDTNITVILI